MTCGDTNTVMLKPALALIVWTFVMWFWMYATRLPAMFRARIDTRKLKRKADLDALPVSVQQIADNYNHLHEQPTLFYALVFYVHIAGLTDALYVNIAWCYVALRVAHSVLQATINFVPARFGIFALATFCLMAIGVRCVMAL